MEIAWNGAVNLTNIQIFTNQFVIIARLSQKLYTVELDHTLCDRKGKQNTTRSFRRSLYLPYRVIKDQKVMSL